MENKVGIRELKQNASAVVARVKAGETITITERGREVAVLSPVKRSWLDQMIESGSIAPAGGDLSEWLRNNPPVSDNWEGPSSEEIIVESRRERDFE
jgi:prevent-host-death family protein